MELKIIEQTDELTHVALVGSLNIEGVHQIDGEFHKQTSARRRPTVVDMSEVDFVSSLGMGMLVGCAQGLRRRGATMVLLNPQDLVEKAMRAAKIDMAVAIADTMEDVTAVMDAQAKVHD